MLGILQILGGGKTLQNDVTNLILTFIYYVVKVHQLHLLSFQFEISKGEIHM